MLSLSSCGRFHVLEDMSSCRPGSDLIFGGKQSESRTKDGRYVSACGRATSHVSRFFSDSPSRAKARVGMVGRERQQICSAVVVSSLLFAVAVVAPSRSLSLISGSRIREKDTQPPTNFSFSSSIARLLTQSACHNNSSILPSRAEEEVAAAAVVEEVVVLLDSLIRIRDAVVAVAVAKLPVPWEPGNQWRHPINKERHRRSSSTPNSNSLLLLLLLDNLDSSSNVDLLSVTLLPKATTTRTRHSSNSSMLVADSPVDRGRDSLVVRLLLVALVSMVLHKLEPLPTCAVESFILRAAPDNSSQSHLLRKLQRPRPRQRPASRNPWLLRYVCVSLLDFVLTILCIVVWLPVISFVRSCSRHAHALTHTLTISTMISTGQGRQCD